jgi:hypothetical protein
MKTIATQIVTPSIEGAISAGQLFARSEIDATESLEVFARTLGTEPTFEHWTNCRVSWINAYVGVKPQAKGNSADKAFGRFKARLNESFGIEAPKAKSEGATKKASERAKKALEIEENYSKYSDSDITGMLQKAYESQAQNPLKKYPLLGELQQVAKTRTKAQNELNRDSLKIARERLHALAKACTDSALIDQASDLLES